MQKTLLCDSLHRQSISTLEIHCHLMLMFGDGVLRLHHLGRGCREFKSGLVSIMNITTSSLADQELVNTVQVLELILLNHPVTIQDLSIALKWFVKAVANIVHVQLGYSSVCSWWVPRYKMEVHKKLMFAGALSLLLSFKGGANTFPESVVTLWDMGSRFYSKWALMQWTHPPSLQPQNVKCANMMEGCCIFILCCRNHRHYIHTLRSKGECKHMLCWLH